VWPQIFAVNYEVNDTWQADSTKQCVSPVLFGPDFVAHSLQTAEGYARRSRLVWAKKSRAANLVVFWERGT
jgi:hypothetical protein